MLRCPALRQPTSEREVSESWLPPKFVRAFESGVTEHTRSRCFSGPPQDQMFFLYMAMLALRTPSRNVPVWVGQWSVDENRSTPTAHDIRKRSHPSTTTMTAATRVTPTTTTTSRHVQALSVQTHPA